MTAVKGGGPGLFTLAASCVRLCGDDDVEGPSLRLQRLELGFVPPAQPVPPPGASLARPESWWAVLARVLVHRMRAPPPSRQQSA